MSMTRSDFYALQRWVQAAADYAAIETLSKYIAISDEDDVVDTEKFYMMKARASAFKLFTGEDYE